MVVKDVHSGPYDRISITKSMATSCNQNVPIIIWKQRIGSTREKKTSDYLSIKVRVNLE